MDVSRIDTVALAMLVQNNWEEFCEFSGGEESAQLTLNELQKDAGLDPDMG